jgi:hypothetical protein
MACSAIITSHQRRHSHEFCNSCSNNDDRLQINLSMLRVSLWLTYITAELLFIDCASNPRYWRRVGEGAYAYGPSDDELAWQKTFLH